MWTCNRLDLQTPGSQPIMPNNLPDHYCFFLWLVRKYLEMIDNRVLWYFDEKVKKKGADSSNGPPAPGQPKANPVCVSLEEETRPPGGVGSLDPSLQPSYSSWKVATLNQLQYIYYVKITPTSWSILVEINWRNSCDALITKPTKFMEIGLQ